MLKQHENQGIPDNWEALEDEVCILKEDGTTEILEVPDDAEDN